MALVDRSGNEIPGTKTVAEVEAEITATIEATREEAQAERVSLQEQLDAKQAELDEAAARLQKASDKDKNFGTLRKEKEAAEESMKTMEKKLEDSVKGIKEFVTNRTKDEMIQRLAGTDKILADKIKLNYERLVSLEKDITDEVIAKVATEAYKLSVDVPQPSVLNRIGSSKPLGGPAMQASSNINSDLLEAGRAFGLSEDDINKYGKK